MKLGSIAIVVVASCACGLVGCSREARPVAQPSEPPPLPPSSGTPIGHLVDSAAELRLSAEQLRKIKLINDDLAVQLAGDNSEMHPEKVAPPPRDDRGRGLGFRAGAMSSVGQRGTEEVGGEMGAFPGARPRNPDGTPAQQIVVPADTVNYVYQQRARHVRDAIRRAFELLDAGQQAIARRLLTDHGVNLDTGETGADPAAPMQEPTPNQPLPREP
jgi:hypothetical protein